MKQETESSIQSAICEYLFKFKKHFGWRSNNVGLYDATKKIHRAMPKYARHGVPDIIVVENGFFIGIEVKKKKAYQSKHQKQFEKDCKEAGGEYYVARSVQDIIDIGL